MTKSTKNKKTKKLKQGYLFIAIGLIAMVVLVFGAYSLFKHANVETRKDRIVAIYDSLQINRPEYQMTSESIFGEKRVYEWDAGRSYSSSRTYERGANVDTTIADLRSKIESAGFHYFDEPYPGGWIYQYHFKSAKNEYIRLSVVSKPKQDAARDEALMSKDAPTYAFHSLDSNAGPSSITIKVNLDDNNE